MYWWGWCDGGGGGGSLGCEVGFVGVEVDGGAFLAGEVEALGA